MCARGQPALDEVDVALAHRAAAESIVVMLPPLPSGYWKQTLSRVGRPGTASTKRTSMPAPAPSPRAGGGPPRRPDLADGHTWNGPPSARAPRSTVG